MFFFINTKVHVAEKCIGVNIDVSLHFYRLQPLLTEVKNDRKTIALGTLDYIQSNTLEYKFYEDYMTRYGFDWRLVFFETFFRKDQVGERPEDPRV